MLPVMGKPRDKHPLEDNPFTDGLLEWMDSPEGQQHIEVSDVLWSLMDGVELDAKQRKFVWPEAKRLTLDQSVRHILKQHPDFPRGRVEGFLISWIENHAPEDYTEEQLAELDRLAAEWVEGLTRKREAE